MMLPALSVRQPWASKLADRTKWIETRTWWTGYRGPLVICSSKLPTGMGPAGMALCIRVLVACRPMTKEDEAGACCEIYRGAQAWVFSRETQVDLKWFDVRGQKWIFPLLVPQSEFFCPEDRELAERCLAWSTEKGYLKKIRDWQPQSNVASGERV